LNGLPGNSTPPSRFVRIAYLKEFANPASNSAEAILLATHLLNDVDIPKGTIRDGKNEDYTQWSVIKDLTQKIFSVRTYDSMIFRAIDLKKIDFGKIKTQTLSIPRISDMKFITVENAQIKDKEIA
jgi:choloylglycine hydrolase